MSAVASATVVTVGRRTGGDGVSPSSVSSTSSGLAMVFAGPFSGILPSSGGAQAVGRASQQGRVFVVLEPPQGGPRMAFAERPPERDRQTDQQQSLQQQRLGRASFLGACIVEAAVVVPTLHVEAVLAEEPWSLLLRILIAAVRLSPIVVPCLPYVGRLLLRCVAGTPGIVGVALRRISSLVETLVVVVFCPEVRWGLAITLDMWYLLTTPLNKGFAQMPYIILLVANIILCFVDTLTLIMMLAVKNGEDLEGPLPESEAGALRPRPVKLGQSDDDEDGSDDEVAIFDPTCIICLSDFGMEDDIVQLPCKHAFHTECIAKWLCRSRHCPLRCPQEPAWMRQCIAHLGCFEHSEVVLPPLIRRTQVEEVLLPSEAPQPAESEIP